MGKSCFQMMIWKGCCILMSKKGRMAQSILVLVSTMSFAVTGCQQDQRIQTDRDVLRVGVVTYTQDDPFINALTDKLKEDLKAMSTKDVKVIVSVKNGDNDQKNQDETIEEMIDDGCDVLSVNLVDRTAPAKIIRLAKQDDIPIVFFNREPVKEDLMQWEYLYYVGCKA